MNNQCGLHVVEQLQVINHETFMKVHPQFHFHKEPSTLYDYLSLADRLENL
jgi:hypothetical protein